MTTETASDKLLKDLHTYAREVLKLEPLVDVVDGLRAGVDWAPAAGCASYSKAGQPVITLDAGYQSWDPAWLKTVFLHECEHLRAGHVAKGARVSTTPRAPVQLTRGDEIRWRYHEAQADTAAAEHVKKFDEWQQQRRLRQLEADIWEIRQLLAGRRFEQQLAASKPQRKAIQPKFGRGHKWVR